jgi:hypothetical protein
MEIRDKIRRKEENLKYRWFQLKAQRKFVSPKLTT